MKKIIILALILAILILLLVSQQSTHQKPQILSATLNEIKSSYWLMLFRKSNVEFLYFGEPGNAHNSFLQKVFKVKSGVPGEKPTPLPKLLGRDYWLITEKIETKDNPETSPLGNEVTARTVGPYFLTLDIPVTEEEPYGPTPYLECGGQCNWIIPGSFGLHGINGDGSKLSDLGSSGCIRHTDLDITHLYNILEPDKENIRYYIKDI